jgi:hypothetical protein
MSLSDTFENDLMKLIMNATAIANVADNAATSPITSIFTSLSTGTLTDTSTQSTTEATYTGYVNNPRVGAARTSGGWTVSAASASNAAALTYGACTAGSNTITDVSLGTLSNGTGKVIVYGALSSSLSVSAGITPSFAIGQLTFTFD